MATLTLSGAGFGVGGTTTTIASTTPTSIAGNHPALSTPLQQPSSTSSSKDVAVVVPRISSRNRERIIDSISHNRITIIVGSTGSGKSTLIPSLVLDELPFCKNKPVLCTQPRRLAVVAIAKRVSQLRRAGSGGGNENNNDDDGLAAADDGDGYHGYEDANQEYDYDYDDDVGYHVGNSNFSTNRTRLLFTTAGILLEQIRTNGISKQLSKFGCIIIDECHERSPESDLILAMIKQYLWSNPKETSTNSPVRIVLMSATFDHQRYKQFFQSKPMGAGVSGAKNTTSNFNTIDVMLRRSAFLTFRVFREKTRANKRPDTVFRRGP